jgi:ComF family protein
MRPELRSVARGLRSLVFAPICLGCDGPLASGRPGTLVCGRCRSRLRPPPPPCCERCGAPRLRSADGWEPVCRECIAWPAEIRVARSAVLLHPPADRLVHQLKYRGWSRLAQPLARRMAEVVLPPDVREEAILVTAVPTTRVRLRERGYNQAQLLAGAFARLTARTACSLLERTGAGATQTRLQPAERRRNVAGAFRASTPIRPELRDAHVLLVDDVLTTGATAGECARVLVAAGARCVSVVTFARAIGG